MRERFVIRERGSETWSAMQQAFGRRQAKLQVAMEITSTETIKQAVIAGMGVSFLSAHTIGMELRVKSLVVLDVRGFPLMLEWYVVHRENKRLPPVAVAFEQFLRDDGASLIERITRITRSELPGGSGEGDGPDERMGRDFAWQDGAAADRCARGARAVAPRGDRGDRPDRALPDAADG
jgi:hypothetical protein